MLRLCVFISAICVLFVTVACSGEKYKEGVDQSAPLVSVRDVMLKPELLNKKVVVQGNIISQCQSSGCWFFLKDSTGQIYVDLAQNNFALPPRIGKTAKVSGIVFRTGHGNILVASGVEIL